MGEKIAELKEQFEPEREREILPGWPEQCQATPSPRAYSDNPFGLALAAKLQAANAAALKKLLPS